MDEDTAERARQALNNLVEAEFESLGGNNNEELEVAEQGQTEDGASILQSMRKRICRDRERHVEVINRNTLNLEIRKFLSGRQCYSEINH